MSQSIVCSSCEEEFGAPDSGSSPWLICPHCGARTPNPQALRRYPEKVRSTGFGIVGTLLLVIASFGTVVSACGGFCLMPEGVGSRVFVAFLSFLVALVAAAVLLRLDVDARHRGGQFVGQGLVVSTLCLLTALAGIVFAFATCFGGSTRMLE
ncbi:MAG TPA: hypothetical protein VE988_13615 [Gemmataceae bacterium]|nr:hypothetical protein [Gemmataceae bacterium]